MVLVVVLQPPLHHVQRYIDPYHRFAAVINGRRIVFRDAKRFGQKGRCRRRWFTTNKRPPGTADQRFTFADIYGAVEPPRCPLRTTAP